MCSVCIYIVSLRYGNYIYIILHTYYTNSTANMDRLIKSIPFKPSIISQSNKLISTPTSSFPLQQAHFRVRSRSCLRLWEVVWRLREVVYGSGKFFYGSGKLFTALGSFFTAPGSLREVVYGTGRLFGGSGKFFYGSGKLCTAPGSFSTAPGSFSTAPGSCLRLREVFLRLREVFYGSGSCLRLWEVVWRLRGVFLRLREVVYGSGKFFYGSGKFFYGSGKFLRLWEVVLRLRELFYGSGKFSTAPGAFLRLREVFYGSGKFFYGSGKFFYGSGKLFTALGGCLRLREVVYGSGKFFYGSGKLFTALGGCLEAPGSCVRLREVFLRLREVFLRLREVVYGSGRLFGGSGKFFSTNSSKNNLSVWAAASGRRRGIYSLYRASTAHATRFGRIEVRCEPRGCQTVFSWRISPYATSTPTRFGPRTRRPQLGSALTFLHSKAPFPCPLQILGQNELRCEPRECSIVLTMCISPHPTSSPTRIRPKLSLFEHRALQRQSAPQIGLRVRAKRGALRNTRLFYSSA